MNPNYAKLFALFADHLGDYMHRWIFKHPWGTIRLHHILRSDDDRHFHDHPWNFVSVILTGGYTEFTPYVYASRWFPRFSVVRRAATDLHRLALCRVGRLRDQYVPVWTLVFTGRRIRKWGFQTENGWIPHDEYTV